MLAAGAACWLAAMLHLAADFPYAGTLAIDLYLLDGLAAFAGWVAGNAWVARGRRGVPAGLRLVAWFAAPVGVLVLLFGLGPEAARLQVPLAPLWAFAVFAIFFLVPVSFRR